MNRRLLVLVSVVAFAVAVLLLAPCVGAQWIPISAFFDNVASPEALILREIRMPRVAVAFLAGAALSISGMAFQAMFRNPLATPFTLGVSGGAALGTVLYLRFAVPFMFLGIPGQSWFGFAGAAAAAGLVYALTSLRRGFSLLTLLLAGVAVNFFVSSIILFIQYLSGFAQSFLIIRSLMGSVDAVGPRTVFQLLPVIVAGGAALVPLAHPMNLLLTGDDIAMSRGVDVPAIRRTIFIAVSLMVGGVVSFCGPIGFVGLMVPHICRLLIGPDHRWLLPTSFIFGGAFLAACDAVTRSIVPPAEIPVGIMTAMLGGPFFIWLLLRSDPVSQENP
ncbi:MAG TPA: iron ABC transporter permease [Verrucomicrobiae bacterium]|nr:iron ABC transporter permease [Verrucomicrobiae bacterium]